MVSAESLYKVRESERTEYLHEAHRNALVSIPALIPDTQDVSTRTTPVRLAKPFQSLGARGVNNLAAKLLIALLPSSNSFFKYEPMESVKDEAEAGGLDMTDINSKLARRESRINSEIEIQGIRSKVYAVVRHLLVAGSVVVYKVKGKGLQVFPLNSFTVKRDGNGTLLDLIVCEKLDRASITDERVLALLDAEMPGEPEDGSPKPVLIYTRVMLNGEKYDEYQEVGGHIIPGTEITHNKLTNPWLALRYTSIDGEDYGRAFVEEYRGDLTSFEQMSRDVLFASANAAKVVWAINPNATVKPKKFMDTPNGGAVSAADGDITAVRLDKGGDMQVAQIQMDRLERALSASFMLNSSFQRQQERVTAEEIRRLAEELEDTLGGVFSLMAQELQLPLAHIMEHELVQTDPDFKALPKGTVRVGVVTGLAAIGRDKDLERLRNGLMLMQEAAALVPGLPDYLIEADLLNRLWTGSGVDTDGLLKTVDEVGEQRQAQAEAEAARISGTEMAKGAGKSLGNLPPEQTLEAAAAMQQVQ
jgi:hypothetical protein